MYLTNFFYFLSMNVLLLIMLECKIIDTSHFEIDIFLLAEFRMGFHDEEFLPSQASFYKKYKVIVVESKPRDCHMF